MMIGFDFFQGGCFQTTVALPSFYRAEMSNSIVDEILIDEDINITDSIDKPTVWGYKCVLNALFRGDLEGGSLRANGLIITSIKFQKRKAEDLFWSDVAMIEFNENTFYEAVDKYVVNDAEYEYSLLPISVNVSGNRIVSPKILVDFDGGVFLSDKDNNYRLYYDVEFGNIENHTQVSSIEPLNSKYPVITYGSADYRALSLKHTSISDATVSSGGKIDIKQEKLTRDKLLKFLKNKRPKIYRDGNGEIILVTVRGNVITEPQNGINGISKISCEFIEVGDVEDVDTLISMGLLDELSSC